MSASPWRTLPIPLGHLSLPLLLRAGQSFRWLLTPPGPGPAAFSEHDAVYSLPLHDRVVQLAQPAGKDEVAYRHLLPAAVLSATEVKPPPLPSTDGGAAPTSTPAHTTTEAWLASYFQLAESAPDLWADWRALDPVFARREGQMLRGIRVLKMDCWECLFSFICSSNNNISRITLMVNAACTSFSPPLLTHSGTTFHAFPPPSAFLAPDTEARLRALGFGYRASFIHRTAVALCAAHPAAPERWLEAVVREWDEDAAREALMGFVGVGRKVADCVLLMSGGDKRKHIVPVDVHVLRIAQKLYGFSGAGKAGQKVSMTPPLYAAVEQSLRGRWGSHAGWVQAVLFASDLPALLKSEPAIKLDAPSDPPALSVLAPLPYQPTVSASASPPPLLRSVKLEEPPSAGAAGLAFRSIKRSVVLTKLPAGGTVKAEPLEGQDEGLRAGKGESTDGAGADDSLGERVKKRRRVAAAAASVKPEVDGR